MLIRSLTSVAAAAIVASVPLAAGAQAPDPGPAAISAATRAYFSALDRSDPQAVDRQTTADFRVVGPDGKDVARADYLAARAARQLDTSTPVTAVRPGPIHISGTTATETVDVSSWDQLMLGNRSWLERDYSTRTLSFTQTADGTWLLREDHITSANHLI